MFTRLLFLIDKIVQAGAKFALCKLFPNILITLEQIHVFKMSVTAELPLPYSNRMKEKL